MKISVTQEHIDKGIRGDACDCPIAKALHEALPKVRSVIVLPLSGVDLDDDWVELPQNAMDFIRDFDTGTQTKWLEPFEFELDYWPEEKE